jgi:hypothetical protein
MMRILPPGDWQGGKKARVAALAGIKALRKAWGSQKARFWVDGKEVFSVSMCIVTLEGSF